MKDARAAQPHWSRSYLAASYRGGDTSEAYALQLLTDILGGGAGARLYKSLVLDRGLALSAGAAYSPGALDLSSFRIWAMPKDDVPVGDLEAAVALYEPDAALLWGPGRAAMGHAAIRRVLGEVMDMRLPLRGRADHILLAGDLALIIGERSVQGTGPDGAAIALTGPATLVVRCQPDGTWLTKIHIFNAY